MKRYRSVQLTYKGRTAEWSAEKPGPLPEFAPEELREIEAMLPGPSAIEVGGLTEEEAAAFFADLDDLAEAEDASVDVSDFVGHVFDPTEEVAAATEPDEEPEEAAEFEGQCQAIKGDGDRCTNHAIEGTRYCGVHAKLAATDGLCKAVQSNGQMCGNKAHEGSDYCGVHAKLEAKP